MHPWVEHTMGMLASDVVLERLQRLEISQQSKMK